MLSHQIKRVLGWGRFLCCNHIHMKKTPHTLPGRTPSANQNPAVSLMIFGILARLISSAHHLHWFAATSSFLHSLSINPGSSEIYLTGRSICLLTPQSELTKPNCVLLYLFTFIGYRYLEHMFMHHLWVLYF